MYFAMVTNTDLTEGRGYQYIVAYFTNAEAAIAAAKGRGVMGTDASVYRVELPVVWDSFDEWKGAGYPAVKSDNFKEDLLIFGYHKNWQGKWIHGRVEDGPNDDPDWPEYKRLKAKFDIKE